eukprot:CAMPEP_0116853734 /NCGR_PEP_ID=MMETSP0418-20121206/18117_1 /TAXON_ID=1158023 /ORGANISM="Astrosyne radiata, Strain 13vi08-1A" /LENGTH=368 /DNA_ID=CAMNT_0004486249 /DNA_START=57 /DNA_END=1163 /DNA_ORIENTATION=+
MHIPLEKSHSAPTISTDQSKRSTPGPAGEVRQENGSRRSKRFSLRETAQAPRVSHRLLQQTESICEAYAIQPGDIDFDNEKRLGGGAWCSVYEVSMNEQRLAMKRLAPDVMMCATPKQIAGAATDMVREAAILSITNHENIVKLHGISAGTLLQNGEVTFDDEEKEFFFLMDKLESTLDDRIRRWRREERGSAWRLRRKCHHRPDLLFERLEVALEMARGLKYLHERKIVHGDIKPGNVGFDDNGVLKIFDFGLARKLKHRDDTTAGAVGTPAYMAPEIHDQKPYGQKADIFSFALTLWQLCTLESRPPQCYKQRPELPKWWPVELSTLMAVCWSAEPNGRPSCDDIIKSIENILKGKNEKSTPCTVN